MSDTASDKVVADGWVSTVEAGDAVGYRAGYIRRLAIEGRIKARKVGRDWFVDLESVRAHKATVKPGRPRKTEQTPPIDGDLT